MKKLNIMLLCSLLLIILTGCGETNSIKAVNNSSKEKSEVKKGEGTKDEKESNLNNNNKKMTGTVTLDLNPPLAGKTLIFDIEMMKIDKGDKAQSGSKVEVNYKGTLEDGTKFDSSYDRGETLPFTVGAKQMIPGFDKAVVGMKVGDKKTVKLAPVDAYGEYDPKAIQVVPKENLKSFVNAGYKLEKGEKIPTQFGQLTIIDSTDN